MRAREVSTRVVWIAAIISFRTSLGGLIGLLLGVAIWFAAGFDFLLWSTLAGAAVGLFISFIGLVLGQESPQAAGSSSRFDH
jgi:hypothetical protein